MADVHVRPPARALLDRNWQLYAVLGGVTLILMIVIARLFPKAEQ
jgi:hypothetical protein